jgi:hypothetical protein
MVDRTHQRPPLPAKTHQRPRRGPRSRIVASALRFLELEARRNAAMCVLAHDSESRPRNSRRPGGGGKKESASPILLFSVGRNAFWKSRSGGVFE